MINRRRSVNQSNRNRHPDFHALVAHDRLHLLHLDQVHDAHLQGGRGEGEGARMHVLGREKGEAPMAQARPAPPHPAEHAPHRSCTGLHNRGPFG
jgi:hypothetical protein